MTKITKKAKRPLLFGIFFSTILAFLTYMPHTFTHMHAHKKPFIHHFLSSIISLSNRQHPFPFSYFSLKKGGK